MSRIVCSGLLLAAVAAMLAQQPVATSEVLNELPAMQGVYYRAPDEWVALHSTILQPYAKSTWRWWLLNMRENYVAQVPGEHAALRTDGQPVFVIRGLASRSTPVLIRFDENHEARSIAMPWQRQVNDPRTPFPDHSKVAVDSYSIGERSVAIRPQAALAPGEYAVIASPNERATRLFLSYDFRVAP